MRKQFKGKQYAVQKGYPCIHLGDAGGGCIPDIMGSAGMMSMVYPIKDAEPRHRRVPLITAILGECFGGAAWTASLSDIVVQVKAPPDQGAGIETRRETPLAIRRSGSGGPAARRVDCKNRGQARTDNDHGQLVHCALGFGMNKQG